MPALQFHTIQAQGSPGLFTLSGPESSSATLYENIYDHIRQLVDTVEFLIVVDNGKFGITVTPTHCPPSSVRLDEEESVFGMPARPNFRECGLGRTVTARLWLLQLFFPFKVSLEAFENLLLTTTATSIPADAVHGFEAQHLLVERVKIRHPRGSEADEGTQAEFRLRIVPASQPIS